MLIGRKTHLRDLAFQTALPYSKRRVAHEWTQQPSDTSNSCDRETDANERIQPRQCRDLVLDLVLSHDRYGDGGGSHCGTNRRHKTYVTSCFPELEEFIPGQLCRRCVLLADSRLRECPARLLRPA